MSSWERIELYKALSNESFNWFSLEDHYYQNKHVTDYKLSDKSSYIKVDLNLFTVATSKLGGPFGLIMDNKMLASGVGDFKNWVLIYSSYGERLNEVLLK